MLLAGPFTKIVKIIVFTALSKSSIFSPQIKVVQQKVETGQAPAALAASERLRVSPRAPPQASAAPARREQTPVPLRSRAVCSSKNQ